MEKKVTVFYKDEVVDRVVYEELHFPDDETVDEYISDVNLHGFNNNEHSWYPPSKIVRIDVV